MTDRTVSGTFSCEGMDTNESIQETNNGQSSKRVKMVFPKISCRNAVFPGNYEIPVPADICDQIPALYLA